ncbi:MAG TPA: hypothetical protein VGW38_28650, partial [Chloroflexota bacterium]|nr:hypothetical protein [Chloroflexota bacterium]
GKPEARRYRLERDPEVKRWLALREREKAAADRYARDIQTKYIRQNIEDHLGTDALLVRGRWPHL